MTSTLLFDTSVKPKSWTTYWKKSKCILPNLRFL